MEKNNKYIIPKKDRIIKVDFPKNPGCYVPVVYIRYYKNIVIYIGETVNHYSGRPLRPRCVDLNCTLEDLDNNKFPGVQGEKREWWKHRIKWDNTDTVRILNAPKDDDQRKKWEAKLVCWLSPKLQGINNYLGKANLDMKSKKNITLVKRINDDKIIKKGKIFSENIINEINHYKKYKRISSKPLTSTKKREVERKIDYSSRRALHELKTMGSYQTHSIISKRFVSEKIRQWFNESYKKMYDEVWSIEEINKRYHPTLGVKLFFKLNCPLLHNTRDK